MLERRLVAAACLITLLGNTGCHATIQPPPPPKPSMPDIGEPPPEPAPGLSRVFISADVPARVMTGFHLLCASTPCVVTLPYGDHLLEFKGLEARERESRAIVRIARTTEVVNHTLGKSSVSLGKAVGAVLLVFGSLTLGVALGLAETSNQRGRRASEDVRHVALAGLGTAFLGGTVFLVSPTYRQEGATSQWAPAPRAAGLGAGFRF